MSKKLISQVREVLETDVFFVDRRRLVRKYSYPDVFSAYDVHPGKLGLRGRVWMGAVGLEGDFSLLVPPAKQGIDAIGYHVRRGEWDWWRFLSFITIPKGEREVALSFSFSHETFFDLSHVLACLIEPDRLGAEADEICTHFSPETTSVSEAWGAFWRVLARECDARVAGPEYQEL